MPASEPIANPSSSPSPDPVMPANAARPVAVVIVAAGSGSRAMRAGEAPKQYRPVAGVPVLERTVSVFVSHPRVTDVVCAISSEHAGLFQPIADRFAGRPVFRGGVTGGATRQSSVRAGLEALARAGFDGHVLIHDAARPFLTHAVIDRCLERLTEASAVVVSLPVVDTVKRADADGRVEATIPRQGLWTAQTPQGFRFGAILEAHRRAAAADRDDFTDDAAVAEWAGLEVRVALGDPANIKLTTAEDFERMNATLARPLDDIRVGTGYDVHSFEPGDHVTLCGVKIAHTHKLNGHSDADVALHALTDAILGALGDGDIGQHFPPTDMRWRGAASEVFLKDALARVTARGGLIAHCDISLIAEAPKVGPHREAMRARVADILGLTIDRVGVKATTNEKLGFVGRKEGIAAIATATVRLPS